MTLRIDAIEGLELLHRGKVRETYRVDDERLLLVATDRLSAFDVVFDQPIPDKGRVLTRLSAWWFGGLASLGPSHFLSAAPDDLPDGARTPELAGRAMLVRRAERVDAECVVRGYLAGSGWAEYRRSGMVGGHRLPEGLREADRLPEPIFTPSTKAEPPAHDAPMTFPEVEALLGEDVANAVKLRSLGFASVSEVRAGKLLRIDFEADDSTAAEAAVSEMCRRLLANPVMEVATWQLRADEMQDEDEALP
jgi:phosphoribosylaminoimidazole-succinocarboxamide synthase